jgi:cystathionine gamma-synthase
VAIYSGSSGFGGMLSFEINGDFDQTKQFMNSLKLIKLATSLGGVTLRASPISRLPIPMPP